jgi:hypothetical protein
MKSLQPKNEHGKWNECDLIERLCHALDIARLAIEHLASEGYTNRKNPAKNIRPEKIVSETAVLLVSASSLIDHPQVGERIRCIAEQLVPNARSKRVMLGLCLEPTVLWDYALPHICLTRIGYPDSVFDELLRVSLESQARAGRERVPYRVLEQEWIAKAWLDPKVIRRPTSRSIARLSILSCPMDLLGATRDDIYAFTHALMYVTDFNLRPARLPRRRDVILGEADVLLARCLDDEDYDLAGEVLLSWPLTGKTWSTTAAFAFRVLAHVEDQAAFLPTPSTQISEIKALEGIERTKYLLATAYHTAYVMGLVCAAALRPGCAPPGTIPLDGAKPGTASQVMRLLDADGQSPHWQREFDHLTEPEADALSGFLLNVALRRRAACRDFEGLRTLLDLAYDLDLANTPSMSQAAEMLIRLTICATAVGCPQADNLHTPENSPPHSDMPVKTVENI